MKNLLKVATMTLVVGFLLLFMVIPMLNLILVGFTGDAIPVLEYLSTLNFAGLEKELGDTLTFNYYLELFDTRRYRQGFLNAIGVAPLVSVAVFLLVRLFTYLLSFVAPEAAKRMRKVCGLPLIVVTFLATLGVVLGWRYWVPQELQGTHFMRWVAPGKAWDTRLLQGLGFCPSVTLVATFLGVSMAFAVSRTTMPLRNFIRMMCIIPLAVPPFLGALALKNLLGLNGVLTRLLTTCGLPVPFEAQSAIAAGFVQAFLFFPFVLLTTAAALDRMDPSLGEAAEVMGARPTFSLWTVQLPVLLPGITAGAFLAFIRSFGDFAALSLLMPMKYPIVVVEAYRDLSGSTYWGGASMLSTIMIGTILGILALQKYFIEGGGYETMTGKGVGEGHLLDTPLVRWGGLAFCTLVLSVPVIFVAATVLVSVASSWGVEVLPTSYTLSRYTSIATNLFRPDSPLVNSFLLVLPGLCGAMFLALVVSYVISRSRHWSRHLLDFATVLPFVVPGVAFAVALICTFNGPPLALHLTALIVICAYTVTRMPYGVRATLASFQQIGRSMEESSKTLGATSALTMVKVIIPLVLPGLAAGAIMIFISAMQDVAVTLMTCPPDWYPASVYVFTQIQEGNVFDASAYGIVLFCLIIVPYSLAWKLGGVKASL